MTTSARDLMTVSAECAHVTETLTDAARRMRDLNVGALPICGEDNQLQGVITDRDIIVKCVADGADSTSTTVQDFVTGKPVTIGADDSTDAAIQTMQTYAVRRLPVIDGHDLIGMLSQADIAKGCNDEQVGALVGAISASASNN